VSKSFEELVASLDYTYGSGVSKLAKRVWFREIIQEEGESFSEPRLKAVSGAPRR